MRASGTRCRLSRVIVGASDLIEKLDRAIVLSSQMRCVRPPAPGADYRETARGTRHRGQPTCPHRPGDPSHLRNTHRAGCIDREGLRGLNPCPELRRRAADHLRQLQGGYDRHPRRRRRGSRSAGGRQATEESAIAADRRIAILCVGHPFSQLPDHLLGILPPVWMVSLFQIDAEIDHRLIIACSCWYAMP